MKNLNYMTTLLFSIVLISSCNSPSIEPVSNTDFSIINGVTIKTEVYKDYLKLIANDLNKKNYTIIGDTIINYTDPKLPPLPTKAPDLSNIKNNDDPDLKGKPLRMVTIGGSLTAGFRDGGYFNESMITSYPNLLARQMMLSKFEQPLFSSNAYNGFGRKHITKNNFTGGPVPKFNIVTNNSAVQEISNTNIILEKYKGNVDNYSLPNFAGVSLTDIPLTEQFVNTYAQNLNTKIYAEFYWRIINKESNQNFYNSFNSQKYDFISIDFGGINSYNFNYFLLGNKPNQDKFITGEDINPANPEYSKIAREVLFMKELTTKNKIAKGILINYPNFNKLPYFTFITNDKIQKSIGNQSIYVRDISFNIDQYSLLPTSEVDSLLSSKVSPLLKKGLSDKNPLSESSVLRKNLSTPTEIIAYNDMINSLGKKYNFAVFDLYSLYEKIFQGGYTTDDGIRVDPTWITGNFFSTDGIFPSAFGQAVITNEIIKSLNRHYQLAIPIMSTKEFL